MLFKNEGNKWGDKNNKQLINKQLKINILP